MDLNRRQLLEKLRNSTRKLRADQWEKGFSHMKRFSELRGHCRISYTYQSDDGYALGAWLRTQRGGMETMDLNRRRRLEALPGWRWDRQSVRWEIGFFHLKRFFDLEGHCQVPQKYKSDDGYGLGEWVLSQRKKQEAMKPSRRQLLECMRGWTWNAFYDQWEEGFSKLKQFSNLAGHCRVPRNYETDEGYKLGLWVNNQRGRMGALEPDRARRLEALPHWAWKMRK
jgi:Helicase associated domain